MPDHHEPGTTENCEPGSGSQRGLVLAGAGGLLAVFAFVAGAAVGHAWEPGQQTPTQFGGPGGFQNGPVPVDPNAPGQGPNTDPGQGNGQGT